LKISENSDIIYIESEREINSSASNKNTMPPQKNKLNSGKKKGEKRL
jgi:hypothetical protein